jgi:hypothetical protein
MDPQTVRSYQNPSSYTNDTNPNVIPQPDPVQGEPASPFMSNEQPTTAGFSSPPQQTGSGGNKFVSVLVFLFLFALGIGVSMVVRSYLSRPTTSEVVIPIETPEPTVEEEIAFDITPTEFATPSTSTKIIISNKPTVRPTIKPIKTIYGIRDARTGKDVVGVSFTLSPNIKPLECDKPNCISQGTNLPGSTRFTVALRGDGQQLRDFRGGAISDATGKEFSMSKTVFQGREAVEYEADFTGSTINSIRFGKMRGIMIALDDGTSIELNHFCPSGMECDFDSDNGVFSTILSSLQMQNVTSTPATSLEKGSGINQQIVSSASLKETCSTSDNKTSLSYETALALANADCGSQGGFLSTHICNNATGTWWIDMDIVKPGCSPACVIDVVKRTAEINYRCTGLAQ